MLLFRIIICSDPIVVCFGLSVLAAVMSGSGELQGR